MGERKCRNQSGNGSNKDDPYYDKIDVIVPLEGAGPQVIVKHEGESFLEFRSCHYYEYATVYWFPETYIVYLLVRTEDRVLCHFGMGCVKIALFGK